MVKPNCWVKIIQRILSIWVERTQHLGLSILDPTLGWNNPTFFSVYKQMIAGWNARFELLGFLQKCGSRPPHPSYNLLPITHNYFPSHPNTFVPRPPHNSLPSTHRALYCPVQQGYRFLRPLHTMLPSLSSLL